MSVCSLTPRAGLLKLDIDRRRNPPPLGRLLGLLVRAGYRPQWLRQERSPSRRGWHLTLAVAPRPRRPEEVVALQAILGSDPLREASNLMRARTWRRLRDSFWRDRWNVLYYSQGGER